MRLSKKKTDVSLTIDGRKVTVPAGTTVFNAAKKAHINIPHLCYNEILSIYGACRVCCVEIKGRAKLEASCSLPAEEGMIVTTNNARIRKARRMITELLLANHPEDCFTCDKNQNCELRQLSYDLGIKELRFKKARKYDYAIDLSSPAIIRDPNKCIQCSRCIRVCADVQGVGAIEFINRGARTQVLTAFNKGLNNVECTNCGQCILVCPTGALREKTETEKVWDAISDPDKFVIVQAAPAVRVAIGEEFGMPAGSLVTGKMAAALRRLNFDKVFDTQFTADLTIIEEANELIHRVKTGGKLPMITSCSPGWIKFDEHFFPGLLNHLSTCKSPQQMFGPIAKTYYAEKLKMDPRKIYVVSVMPCTAKKFEAQRPEMTSAFDFWKKKMHLNEKDRFFDVDAVLTTREAARMMKEAGIDFVNLPDEEFDKPLGISTGAGTIFGASGGVMEAALRTAYEVITGKTLKQLDFKAVRGMKGIKETEVTLNGLTVKVAAVSGLANAKKIMKDVEAGKSPYHFIEIMCCPGGCLAGGGQPIPTTIEIKKKRAAAVYREDRNMPIRKSHENPAIKTLYSDFLKKPLGEKCHALLHTRYTKRKRY
ncbi:MAG: iron hydrogenase small subunit [Elusimicrobia bacterium]|nr:iron hydrogenase small subunit [Elusimicrobiota bacterium]